MSAIAAAPTPQRLAYDPLGGARALLFCREREVLLEGPANTGKSYAGLWKLHLAALKYPGMHGLLLRKTFVSLKASTMVTFKERILGSNSPVRFWSAKGDEAAHYAYPNGSKIYVGGMDKPDKIMSTEFDIAMWDEATDGAVDEWEALKTRLGRWGKVPYAQAIACCNPQQPSHWLNQRGCPIDETYERGVHLMQRIKSRHEDNPTVTADYLEMLKTLTGVRKSRLYYGEWAAADGMVYEDSWDATKNIQARRSISKNPDEMYGDCGIPHEWPRYLAIDFGFTLQHPFVCQWWAEDGEGALWMYREIYLTGTLVEDHAYTIRKFSRWGATPNGDPFPRAIICDHDAEGRATLEKHLGLRTIGADKRVLEGIQAVAVRMRAAQDGRPRLFYLRDSLIERDRELVDAKRPTCTAEEVESYIWKMGSSSSRRDEVEKDNDHGLDATRYLCMFRDMRNRTAKMGAKIF